MRYVVEGGSEPEIIEAIRSARRGQMSLLADLGASPIRHLLRRRSEKKRTERFRINDHTRIVMQDAAPDGRPPHPDLESIEDLLVADAQQELSPGAMLTSGTTTPTAAIC